MLSKKIFSFISPLFRFLDEECAHNLSIKILENAPLFFMKNEDDPRLAISVFGQDFANPIGIAAGFDKNAKVADKILQLGFGFVEVGGVTQLPQLGNDKPRVFRLPKDEAIINRYGLNSVGMEEFKHNLESCTSRKGIGIIGVNLGANKTSDDRIGDYVKLLQHIGNVSDFVTLNISSPNTPGLRNLEGKEFLQELLQKVLETREKLGINTKVLLKIAPDLSDKELDEIINTAREHKIDGMIVSNTTIARPDFLKEKELAKEIGGLSGKPLFHSSTVMLAKTFIRVEGDFPLIGVGGITKGADAPTKIKAGASLVQLYSGLVYKGISLLDDMKKSIVGELETSKASSITEIVGKDAKLWAEA